MVAEAVLETLRQLWRILRQNDVQAAVVGGLALACWKHPRATLDVDVLITCDAKQLAELIENLERGGFKRKRNELVDLGDTDLLQFTYAPPNTYIAIQVDLLLAKSEYARESLHRSIALAGDALGFEIQVLGCEDLILLKLLANRIIDRADAAALMQANEALVDQSLLDRLAAKLGLSDALADLRLEAS